MTVAMPFVGRLAERQRFAAWAQAAATGHPWLVTIEGPAGSGKSALMRACLDDLGDGFATERAYGDELAVDAPMGLLGQVIDVDGEPPFTAALRLIDRFGERQAGGAVAVLAIEDLHWTDQPSLQALVTALRRLDHDRVLVVATMRQDEPMPDERWSRLHADPDRCRRVTVPPLTSEECAELAAAAGADLAPDVAERLARHTAGNALYVRTLLDELTADQLTGPGPNLPVPRSLSSIVSAQVAALPSDAQAVCEALAVLGGRAPVTAVEAVSGVGSALDAIAQAPAGSLVVASTSAGRPELSFAHPLQETAVYDDLAPGRRRQLHAAAAAVLAPEEALRHRVLAADPDDVSLDQELTAAARRAAADGSSALAARYLQWASEIAGSDDVRIERSLEASLALVEAGQLAAAQELCATPLVGADHQLAHLVTGILAGAAGDAERSERLLREAARGADGRWTARALVQLGYLYTALSRGTDAVDAVAPVSAIAGVDADQAQLAAVLHAIGISQQRGARAGLADLAEGLPDDRSLSSSIEALVVGTRGMLELYAGRHRDATASLRGFIERAQRGLQTLHLARVETLLGLTLIARGSWDEAAVHARTAIDLAEDEGLVLVLAQAQAVAAMALAPGSASASATGYIERARRSADIAGTAEADAWARLAEASLAEAEGRLGDVVTILLPLEGGSRDEEAPMFAALWTPLLAGALVGLGRTSEARPRVDLLAKLASRRNPELAVVAATLEGRLAAHEGHGAAALRTFERAEALVTPDTPVLDRFDLGRRFGAQLLIAGRLEDARHQLRAAELLVAPLGSGPLVERVRADLDAAGADLGSTPDGPEGDLTERERDVVALVRQGYTNREVAETLFVSIKAVEYHMGNIFSKLGIRSRRELRTR